jgi:hypothetical protein
MLGAIFTEVQKSTDAAVQTLSQNVMYRKSTSEDAVTLTPQEVVNAVYHQTGTPGTSIKTLPTAAELYAYILSAAVGTSFDFIIYNGGDGELTLADEGAATIVINGTATITAAKARKFRFVFTSATHAECYAMAENA